MAVFIYSVIRFRSNVPDSLKTGIIEISIFFVSDCQGNGLPVKQESHPSRFGCKKCSGNHHSAKFCGRKIFNRG